MCKHMEVYREFPILMVDNSIQSDTIKGRVLRQIADSLRQKGFEVVFSTLADMRLQSHVNIREQLDQNENLQWILSLVDSQLSGLIFGWDRADGEAAANGSIPIQSDLGNLINLCRERNHLLPIFLMTDKLAVQEIPIDTLSQIDGYIWEMEDSPDFIAGRIERAAQRYFDQLASPFFKVLMDYCRESKYSWHTPGHMGGAAFMKSPTGRIFHQFFGENVFRSDLSCSVPELGSLLEHSGVLQEAEKNAAKVFGADHTYFVTNGTSTANRLIWQGMVNADDIVLVDRNCHKSIMQAIVTTNAIPIYLKPTRNDYGIIGPIRFSELSESVIKEKILKSPLIREKSKKIKISVITNSTYDGICYHVGIVKERLRANGARITENLHFDEAWYAYARFNPMYDRRYATYYAEKDPAYNLIFATHSTHKLLAAFSQASMIHIMDQRGEFSHGRFNESFMMHASTSPQYGIIASLDVAAKMMEGNFGKTLTQESIVEANIFRKKMAKIKQELTDDWWFQIWQPDNVATTPERVLNEMPSYWELQDRGWHGFDGLADHYVMLDPIKVTVLTPGIGKDDKVKLPASLVSKFLRQQGIVAEKTGFYSFLILFSIGITKGQSGTLMAELFKFKQLYDANQRVAAVFPDLAEYYGDRRLQDLCSDIHQYLESSRYKELSRQVYDQFPEQVCRPNYAYQQVVSGNVELVPLDQLNGRVAAVMVAPYPPGIPVIMPGERFNKTLQDYLQMYQRFDRRYPGFETEIHGIEMETDPASGKKEYKVYCVKG